VNIVLTYNAPHRKTQDTLLRLKAQGCRDVLVIATPWQDRPSFQPLIRHRPGGVMPIALDIFCKNLNYDFELVAPENLSLALTRREVEWVLIAGAGILPKDIVAQNKVINSHPGYLPVVRGLDALKWSVYEGLPIGVTTHVVSDVADAGLLIKQQLVEVKKGDTFHTLAYRQYEMEISMLVEALEDIKSAPLNALSAHDYPVRRRMPHSKEKELFARFEKLIVSK